MNNEKIDIKVEKVKDILSKQDTNLEKYKQMASVLFERVGKKELVQEWQVQWMNELRAQGKSYEDLAKILGLSLSSVRYHMVKGEKEKMKQANLKNRQRMRANPTAWKAYTEYQKEYQRRLSKERKEKTVVVEATPNANN